MNRIPGDWPVVDVIVMTDYGNPVAANGGAAQNGADTYLQIHMKLAIATGAEAAIQSGNLELAFQKILAANNTQLPTSDPDHIRSVAVLAAALGKFDDDVGTWKGGKR